MEYLDIWVITWSGTRKEEQLLKSPFIPRQGDTIAIDKRKFLVREVLCNFEVGAFFDVCLQCEEAMEE